MMTSPDDNLKRMLTQLASEHAHERNEARDECLDHPDVVRPALLDIVTKGKSANLVCEAMSVLGLIGNEADVPVLAAILNRPSGPLTRESAQALGSHPSKLALQTLLDALEHEDPEVGGASAVALGLRGEETARKPLEKLLGKQNESVRYRAVYALQKLGAATSAEMLRQHIKQETSESVRKLIDEGLHESSKALGV